MTVLGVAYIAEYGFGILPCEFCIIERGVYVGIIIAGIIGLRSEMFGAHGGMLIQLIILSMGIVFTAYHVGVEYHWWAGPPSCSGGGIDAATFEEIVQIKASHHAFARFAKIIGMSIKSGGKGKKELSAKEIKVTVQTALGVLALRIVQS